MRVLLTSFEPFGGQNRNSSLEVARGVLATPPAGIALSSLLLPVVAGACVETAWQHIDKLRPDLVLALGQASGAPYVRLEDRALNREHFTLPDNAGVTRSNQPVVPDGPAVLSAGIPIDEVLLRLRGQGFAVLHSLSAGSYVCNHLYYHLLHRSQQSGMGHKTLFVHLPYLSDQVQSKAYVPTQPLTAQVDCVRAIVRACLD